MDTATLLQYMLSERGVMTVDDDGLELFWMTNPVSGGYGAYREDCDIPVYRFESLDDLRAHSAWKYARTRAWTGCVPY